MVTYASLSAQDKAIVDNTVNLIRAGAGEITRVYNHLIAIANDTNAIALVTSVDAGETIPNTSGLAGADDMTRSELVAVFTAMDTIRQAEDDATWRAQASKAAGINALLG